MAGVRVAGITALVIHIGLGLVAVVLFLAAFGWQVGGFLDPAGLVSAGASRAALLRWAAAADLLSYYLPIPVIAYAFWRALRRRSAVVADLAFAAACAYAVAGGIAAATLAVVGPQLMEAYAGAGEDRAALAVGFTLLMGGVYAIWQFLDPLLLAGWWLGVAALTRRDAPGFARLSTGLGVITAAGAVLNLLQLRGVLTGLLGVVFAVWLGWSLWALVMLWRRRPPFDGLPMGSRDGEQAVRT